MAAEAAAPRLALLELGFRPFYLLAGAYAAISLPLWILQYRGWLPGPGLYWHAHEMLFGFAFAVIAGFLLTAVRSWTGRPTPTGAALAGMAGLWLAARLAAPFSLPAASLLDAAFAGALAWGIGRPMVAAGNRRNFFFIALVLGLGAASVAYQAWPHLGLAVGLDIVLFVMAVMGGRVIPMFTNNAVPGAGARRWAWLEAGALGSILLLLTLEATGARHEAALVALAAGLLHAARLALWAPLRSARIPILWILHASYAWIAAHLMLRGLAGLGLAPAALATHALTVGAIGGLTLGMMARTSRGHTARPLRAGPLEFAAFVLVQAAALVRVLVPLVLPAAYNAAVIASALLWSAAFTAFVVAFVPILMKPRLDGRPG